MTINLILPMPPSVNVAYGNGQRGRYKTKAYKKWEKECLAFKNKTYSYIPTKGMVLEASYYFYSNWFTASGAVLTKDVSNYFKVLEDSFKNYIKGFDDKYLFYYKDIKKIQSDKNIVVVKIKEVKLQTTT